MDKELIIPTYRAKKIDSDEYVEGYYFHTEMVGDYIEKEADEREEWIEHYLVSHMSHDTWDDEEGYTNHINQYKIDPSTLAISFDNSKTWYEDFNMIDVCLSKNITKITDNLHTVTGIQE